MTEILVLIPARGGSKSIPRKNIRDFSGYPLIAWSIAAGLSSELVTRVIVSTDDEEIAAIAKEFGAETPFMRPLKLAQDDTTDLPVFEHALKWLENNQSYHPDVVIQLRPTSPIRPRELVDDAIRVLLENKEADCVRGVVPAGQNPYKMWRLPDGEMGPMENLLNIDGITEPYNTPRQRLPSLYWQTGHIDAIRTSTILEKGSLTGDVIYPLVIDSQYAVDLDNLQDWSRYEYLLMTSRLECVSPVHQRRLMPEKIKLLVLDFDGVISNNLVWTDQDGREMVAASRSDSIRISALREAGVETIILSSESNPVVSARAKKMGVEAFQGLGLHAKSQTLKRIMKEKGISSEHVVHVGNDVNDLPVFEIVGWSVAVADAYPEVIRAADFVLSKPGGAGAVRELCDLILRSIKENNNGS
ncbi:MAG: acylneuraminate cytidylyltransferase [Anaerolineae bacterium]|nr:acylneuraminate cytidylyltransferase [Anaerolineae bacterium]MDK1119602.1 acylneuraminate cytidylyltransferase [Anaerolineae bacterium]